jgi:hypothetical protein
MTPTLSVMDRDDLLARFSQGLRTRTMRHVAEEARLDGESLKQGVERYEIDYAWHVLGSQRLLDECLSAVEVLCGHPVDPPHRENMAEILRCAAAAQPADALMSFDNDVAENLAELLVSRLADIWGTESI